MTPGTQHSLYPWLEIPWQRLLRLHAHQKFPHALLIAGPQGLGKMHLATALVQQLLGQRSISAGAALNHHPDYRCLGEDDQAVGIDDIREITHFLNQTSHQGGPKVILLSHVDKLPLGAANALLKTLEEPSTNTHIILVADQAQGLLATLKSRCFLITVATPTHAMAWSWLTATHPHIAVEDLQWCLTIAGGAPLRAQQYLRLHQEGTPDYQHKNILQFLKADWVTDGELHQFMTANPHEALYLFYYGLAGFIRYLLQCSTAFLFTAKDLEDLSELAKRVSLSQALIFLEKIKEALEIFAQANVNKTLLLESLFYQWYFIQKDKEIA